MSLKDYLILFLGSIARSDVHLESLNIPDIHAELNCQCPTHRFKLARSLQDLLTYQNSIKHLDIQNALFSSSHSWLILYGLSCQKVYRKSPLALEYLNIQGLLSEKLSNSQHGKLANSFKRANLLRQIIVDRYVLNRSVLLNIANNCPNLRVLSLYEVLEQVDKFEYIPSGDWSYFAQRLPNVKVQLTLTQSCTYTNLRRVLKRTIPLQSICIYGGPYRQLWNSISIFGYLEQNFAASLGMSFFTNLQ